MANHYTSIPGVSRRAKGAFNGCVHGGGGRVTKRAPEKMRPKRTGGYVHFRAEDAAARWDMGLCTGEVEGSRSRAHRGGVRGVPVSSPGLQEVHRSLVRPQHDAGVGDLANVVRAHASIETAPSILHDDRPQRPHETRVPVATFTHPSSGDL